MTLPPVRKNRWPHSKNEAGVGEASTVTKSTAWKTTTAPRTRRTAGLAHGTIGKATIAPSTRRASLPLRSTPPAPVRAMTHTPSTAIKPTARGSVVASTVISTTPATAKASTG